MLDFVSHKALDLFILLFLETSDTETVTQHLFFFNE